MTAGESNNTPSEQLARRSEEVEVLSRIALDLNATLDLDSIYEVVLRTMDEFFGFRHSIILLLDDPETLRVVASHGYEGQALGGTVAVGIGIIGMVAKRRRLMRVNHLRAQQAYFERIRSQMQEAGRAAELGEVVVVPGLRDADSQIAIPLRIKDKLIGVFSVESREPEPFSQHDETLVTIVASQAASAIQNALLYRSGEDRRKELAEAHERLKQLNETLEDRVRTRTRELEQANKDLRETQAQLVRSSTMASLGTLAAGIAHELNTPMGAIHSNADVERRAVRLIRGILRDPSVASKLGPQPRLERTLRIFDDMNQMTLEAAERVTKIVQSLKSFARLDQPALEWVDLHEGIESTLTLMEHLIKDRIQVVRNYGELPKVKCYASQINQVFANVLSNAAQAIDGSGSITITTGQEQGDVVIRVADTGRGIKPEHLERIFDPGFTTKGVGVGTGLGLSITYRIIESHQGSIHVDSQPGRGTTFTLRLPITSPPTGSIQRFPDLAQ
jgi:signal transduction histidine kinase